MHAGRRAPDVRYYILDDVVDPRSRQPLRVEDERTVERAGPVVDRCRTWCGYRGRPADEAAADDCRACSHLWIESGRLVSPQSEYPIVDGIPRLLVSTAFGDRDAALRASVQ